MINCIDHIYQKGGSLLGPQNCEINHGYFCCCHHYLSTVSILKDICRIFSPSHHSEFLPRIVISSTVPRSTKEQISNVKFPADEKEILGWGFAEFLKSHCH